MGKNHIITFLLDILNGDSYTIELVDKKFKCRKCKDRKDKCVTSINENGKIKCLYICKDCFTNNSEKGHNISVKRLSEDPKLPHLKL